MKHILEKLLSSPVVGLSQEETVTVINALERSAAAADGDNAAVHEIRATRETKLAARLRGMLV